MARATALPDANAASRPLFQHDGTILAEAKHCVAVSERLRQAKERAWGVGLAVWRVCAKERELILRHGEGANAGLPSLNESFLADPKERCGYRFSCTQKKKMKIIPWTVI